MKIPKKLKIALIAIAIPVAAAIAVALVYFVRFGRYVGGIH